MRMSILGAAALVSVLAGLHYGVGVGAYQSNPTSDASAPVVMAASRLIEVVPFMPEAMVVVNGNVSLVQFASNDVYRDTGTQSKYNQDWLDDDADGVVDVRAPVCCTCDEGVEVTLVSIIIP